MKLHVLRTDSQGDGSTNSRNRPDQELVGVLYLDLHGGIEDFPFTTLLR